MLLENIASILADEPKFRVKQIYETVFLNLINDWGEATNLPLDLRKKLSRECPIKINAKLFTSAKKSNYKALITLDDGVKIETVLMRHADGRNTVCVSSQVGCPLGCKFCATGRLGFTRNLTPMEIVAQVLFFARMLKKENDRVSNVVIMGMGEPFLNYDNVWQAIRILNDKEGLKIGARKISISTSGIIEGIERMARERLQVNLAISLHAPNNELRSELMPINKNYPLKKVLAAVEKYYKTTNRRVMIEYVMIDGVNDSMQQAEELVKLLPDKKYLVNLIAYNDSGVFRASPRVKIKKFKSILERAGIEVVERYRFGADIHAACGQLAAK